MTINEIQNDAARCGYKRLPEAAADLLHGVDAPPRLIAHHVLVHDTAVQLLDGLKPLLPGVIDGAAVCFGAATHDIGKVVRLNELSEPGKKHEEAGRALLVERGVSNAYARFALTHGLPFDSEAHDTEDLLVVLADKCWKGKRVHELEERLARELATAISEDFFATLLKLSDLIEKLTNTASSRLDWQNKHPVSW